MQRGLLTFCISLLIMQISVVVAQEKFAIKYGPYLQNAGNTEVTIIWTTNYPGVSWVEIAPDDGSHFYAKERPQYFDTSLGKKNIGTLHRVVIDSLTPQTKYRYRILTRRVTKETSYDITYGEVAATNVYRRKPLTFSTLNSNKPTTNVMIVNDIHADSALFASLVKNEPLDSVDMVVFNGDMVSHMNSEKELFDGFLSQSAVLFASEKPTFMVRGNHESRGVFAPKYMDYFPTPTGKPYYTFKQGPAFFIVLDPGEDKPDNDIEYDGLADFDKYRRQEAKWLEDVLSSKEFAESKIKIVFLHIPPVGGNWHGHIELNRLFIPLLNKAGIDVMVCAHEHAHSYFKKDDKAGIDFPILINSNTHSSYMQIADDFIKVRIKDAKGSVVKNIQIKH